MYADGDSLQYIDKMATESYLNVRTYPSSLNKKVGSQREERVLRTRPLELGLNIEAAVGLLVRRL